MTYKSYFAFISVNIINHLRKAFIVGMAKLPNLEHLICYIKILLKRQCHTGG